MKKVYIITWEDICYDAEDMHGISCVLSTPKSAKTALQSLREHEKNELIANGYKDAESMIEDFKDGFEVNFGYNGYKTYEIIEKEVE